MRWVLGGDHRDGVLILGGETTEHVEDLGRLAHGLADIVQGVGELLQLAGVGLDVHVALEQAPELSLQVNGSVKLVIPELIMDRIPDGVRRGLGVVDDGTNVIGDGVVEPARDALVYHGPLAIAAVGGSRRRGEMRADAEFADEGIEKAPPLGVIRFGYVELDGDVGLDVDGL